MTQENAHIHERTCIACGKKASKTGLLRIVRTGEGIAFDATGKAAGRGAYVCSPACFEKVRVGRLAHALKTNISDNQAQVVAEALHAHLQTV